jgi:hypothetical protein
MNENKKFPVLEKMQQWWWLIMRTSNGNTSRLAI